MEKEIHHSDSMTTVTIKPEYAPSEIYSSEPPPAYPRTQSSVVQVAKIIAVTMVLMSIILGGFILASAYVTATASCKQMEQDMDMLNDVIDRIQLSPSPEALVQAESLPLKSDDGASHRDDLEQDATKIVGNNVDSNEAKRSNDPSVANGDSEESEDKIPILIKLPLELDFDDIAGALLEKNQKSRMNCVVEKKRSEETIDHKPRTLNLPFGLNITTNPRQEHLSGERMAIFCESGNMQKQVPSDEDQDDESIIIQPVMIPIPPSSTIRQMPTTVQQLSPIDTMRVPVPLQENQNQLPPNQILHHIAQQIIARNIVDAQTALREQNQNIEPTLQSQQKHPLHKKSIPIPAEILSQLDRLPNHDVIVTVTQQEYDESPEDLQRMSPDGQEFREISQNIENVQRQMNVVVPEIHPVPQQLPNMPGRSPANPFLRELRSFSSELEASPEMMRGTTQQDQSPQHSSSKESYVRLLPVQVPLEMNRREQQELRSTSPDELRPHYVQPRSVRSVDTTFSKSIKRVKRCSCDCAC